MRAAGLFSLVVMLGCCARANQSARPLASDPAPIAGVVHSAGTFASSGNAVLFEQCWKPAGRAPSSVVVIVHGIKDHSSRYAEFARQLVRAGHAACGFDHRGHGRSSGRRFDLFPFSRDLDDTRRYLDIVRQRFPGAPLFLFGHSMGGVLVPLYVIEHQPSLAGVILSAPALHPPLHPFAIAGLLVASRVAPNAPLLDAPAATFSPDPQVVAAMRRDPLITHGRGTGRMAAELARGIRRVWSRIGRLRTPILILSGTDDHAVDPHGSIELRRRAGSTDATLHMYRGAGHDLIHDPQHTAIVRDIIHWVEARTH